MTQRRPVFALIGRTTQPKGTDRHCDPGGEKDGRAPLPPSSASAIALSPSCPFRFFLGDGGASSSSFAHRHAPTSSPHTRSHPHHPHRPTRVPPSPPHQPSAPQHLSTSAPHHLATISPLAPHPPHLACRSARDRSSRDRACAVAQVSRREVPAVGVGWVWGTPSAPDPKK